VESKVQQKVIKYLGPVDPVIKRKKNLGRKPSIFVRELTKNEKDNLQSQKYSNISFKRDRALIILYSSMKQSVEQICNKISRERKMVVRVIKDFNNTGLKVLERKKSPGAKPKFTNEQRAKLLHIVSTPPKIFGLAFTTWSLPRLKRYIIERKIVSSICIQSIKNILVKEGVYYQKSRKWMYSKDPDFLIKTSDRLSES
jgi:transposase